MRDINYWGPYCVKCGHPGLMRILEDDTDSEIYLSAHEIAAYAQCSVRTVERLALRPDKVRRWEKLYEWHDAMRALPRKTRESA